MVGISERRRKELEAKILKVLTKDPRTSREVIAQLKDKFKLGQSPPSLVRLGKILGCMAKKNIIAKGPKKRRRSTYYSTWLKVE